MTNSHVYAIRGDITHLKCDAWMLPSDSKSSVTTVWTDAVPELAEAVSRTSDTDYSSGELHALPLHRWPEDSPLPIMTAVPLHGFDKAEDLRPRITAFVQAGAREARRRRESGSGGRPIPLLAMPLLGASGGGGHLLKGDILEVILDQARLTATEEGVDVVLVLRDERTFALAQVKRKPSKCWEALDRGLLKKAQELAEIAKTGRLVPFMGAGTSVSAGAPTWANLIKLLAQSVGLSNDERNGIRRHRRQAHRDPGSRRRGPEQVAAEASRLSDESRKHRAHSR